MQDWTVISDRQRYTFSNPQPGLYDRMAAVKRLLPDRRDLSNRTRIFGSNLWLLARRAKAEGDTSAEGNAAAGVKQLTRRFIR